jgi:hypothetical protein
MRFIRNLVGMVVLAVLFNACFTAPEFADVPEISYNSLQFADVAEPGRADTLILKVDFKDGDGDLGLDANYDVGYPYNDKFYFRLDGYKFPNAHDDGSAIDTSVWIHYTSRTVPGLDTLPLYIPPYKCENWEVFNNTNGQPRDTVYFQQNPNHFNFFVDILVQQPDKSFKVFDWATELPDNCDFAGFNGRFPILSKDISVRSTQEGTIRYKMTSAGWTFFFSIEVLKLRVHIQDRALHISNTIETPEFQLSAI